jgi:beta-fructofuranosidase
MVSWLGLPDTPTPTEGENWAGCLSLVRELSVQNDRLIQYPVKELKRLRRNQKSFQIENGYPNSLNFTSNDNCYEIELNIPPDAKGMIKLAADDGQVGGLTINYDNQQKYICVDRSASYNNPSDCIRKSVMDYPGGMVLNIFIDRSIFEIFANKGQKALSGRFFPTNFHNNIFI